ncbi:SGNH hydrolase domain-containing protein [Sphingomonas sp. MMS24-JH45]
MDLRQGLDRRRDHPREHRGRLAGHFSSIVIADPISGGSPESSGILSYRDRPDYTFQFRKGSCFIGEGECSTPPTAWPAMPDRPNAVVLGDSHAAHYWRAIAVNNPRVNVIQATASGCRPTVSLRGEARCTSVVDLVLNKLADQPEIGSVVFAGRWRKDDLPPLAETVRNLSAKGLDVPRDRPDGRIWRSSCPCVAAG